MAERETLSAPRITRDKRARMDLEKLWLMPEFKRFAFTWLNRAHMFTGIYGTEGRHLAFGEGRRSLGYDFLRALESIDASALPLIMVEEMKSQKEAPHAKSKPYDHLRDLKSDDPLGFDSDTPPGTGLWLYGTDPDAE